MKRTRLIALTTCLLLLGSGLAAQTDVPRIDENENMGYVEISIQTNDGNYVLRGLAEDNPSPWPVKCSDPCRGMNYSEVIGLIEDDAEFIFGGTVSFEDAGDYEIYLQKPLKRDDPPCIDCLPYDIGAVEGETLDGGGMDAGRGKCDYKNKGGIDESEEDFVDLGNLSTKPHFGVFAEPTGPTSVPFGGGDLEFKTGIWNHENESVTGDLWIVVLQPSGHEVVVPGNSLRNSNPTLDRQVPSGFVELNNSLIVPPWAVAGTYELIVRIGYYPDITIDEDSFEFYVIY
jgi:hypothetical protein